MAAEAELLAQRICRLLAAWPGLTTKRMFGGTCFLLNGNMCAGVTGRGELMVRVGPDAYEACLALPCCREMDFTGKPMRGMIYVGPAAIESDRELDAWLQKGIDFAGMLPPKPKKR